MTSIGTFPFGEPLLPVCQENRTPKKVFVLGVYSSAVHARWLGPDGKIVVNAMAVASEPYIFWRGDGVDKIVDQISIPPEVGALVPAPANLNGPSGIALDDCFLTPLGIDRKDAWLCDLVSHSCVNPAQMKAIQRSYEPLREQHGLPKHSIPPVPTILTDERRRGEILQELRESQAETLILLGDQPIKWFLNHFDDRWERLSDFQPYGQKHRTEIDGMAIDVLPLVHPRQAARLGASSKDWHDLHQQWMADCQRGTDPRHVERQERYEGQVVQHERSTLGERMDLPSHEYLDWTQCVYCKHLGEPKTDGVPRPTCKAFPDGVPDDIVTNKFDHRNPYEGDNGVTFERDDEES